jgi:sugar phosphate permease
VKKPFYGWTIVGVGFLSIFVGVGTTIDALAVFVKPMSESLGWSRTSIMGAYTVGAISSALASPFVGRIIDKYGARVLMPISAVIGGGLLMGLAGITQPWHFYLLFGVGLGVARPCFSMVSAMTTVSNWFIVRRGRALALTTMGAAVSALVIIPLTQYFVIYLSWRNAWIVLGGMTWVLLAIPSAIFIRRRPEDLGLLPDGEIIKDRDLSESVDIPLEINWTGAEAMRTPTFWFLQISQILIYFAVMGIWMHAIASFTDHGVTPAQAAIAMGSISLTSIPSRIIWGLIAEKYNLQICTIICYLGLGTSVIVIMLADSFFMALAGIAINGTFFGGVIVLQSLVWPEYFGRESLGTIQGYSELFRVIGFAGGPLLAGIIFDLTGSYYAAFTSFAVGCVIASFFMYLSNPPKK